MHVPPRHRTERQLRRIVLLTLALLAWMARILIEGVCVADRRWRQRQARASLDAIARRIKMLAMIRAGDLLARRRKPSPMARAIHGRVVRRRHFRRSVFGSALRKALRHRDAAARVAALIGALARLEHWAARIARRLRRGLTRYRAQAFAHEDAACISMHRPLAAIADSS